jgi:hypothetical protein
MRTASMIPLPLAPAAWCGRDLAVAFVPSSDTVGVATKDDGKQENAVADLIPYTEACSSEMQ